MTCNVFGGMLNLTLSIHFDVQYFMYLISYTRLSRLSHLLISRTSLGLSYSSGLNHEKLMQSHQP